MIKLIFEPARRAPTIGERTGERVRRALIGTTSIAARSRVSASRCTDAGVQLSPLCSG